MKSQMEPEDAGLVTINHRSLYTERYNCSGRSIVVLLHHGLGTISAWKNQIPGLVKGGYSVIVYDRWGYGRSDLRNELLTPGFESDLQDLQALIEHFEINTFSLVGHSDGGTLGLFYTAAHPQRVESLVVIGAHIYFEPKMQTGIEAVRHQYLNDDRFRKALSRIHKGKYEQVFNNWFEGWHKSKNQSWDLRLILNQITCPCLVVQGAQDEHATEQHAIDLAKAIPQAQLWLIPDAGHMLPQDNPDLINQS